MSGVQQPVPEMSTVPDEAPLLSEGEYQKFLRDGYLYLGPLLGPPQVGQLRAVFDDAWATGDKTSPEARCWILEWAPFRAILGSRRLLGILDVLFQGQAQLLDYYPIYQSSPNGRRPPGDDQRVTTVRDWHRDFTFVRDPGGSPLMITVLMFADDICDQVGPTLVLPGSHRVPAIVVPRHDQTPRAEEQPLPVKAGHGLMLNSAIVHSRGLNQSDRPRRGVVLNFGHWWMKPWDMDLPLPQHACAGLPAEVQSLLGLRSPCDNLYLFAPI
jgi:Phytanoyl-CoA dioxygenase (PhyH)